MDYSKHANTFIAQISLCMIIFSLPNITCAKKHFYALKMSHCAQVQCHGLSYNSECKLAAFVCLSSSVCVYGLKPHFHRDGTGGWLGRWVFWGIGGTRLTEIGKHSWGHTSLVGLRLNGPLHTFISVFAQGMCPNLHTLISARSPHRGPTGRDESDPVHSLANSSTAKLECFSLYKGL